METSYQFSEVFEFFDMNVIRKKDVDLLDIIFECDDDDDIHRHLIDFRKTPLEVNITQSVKPKNISNVVLIKSSDFKINDFKIRSAGKMEQLRLILTCSYKKELEISGAKLRREDCQVSFNAIQKELEMD
ncbi:hypothetical protein KAR91_32990 [Candidatus Pacearchaeota archaeon]|nr:hypothetical protein [Candidatus Pacearchaeota archaeon]